MTPTTQPISQLDLSGTLDLNDNATDFHFVYPANLFVDRGGRQQSSTGRRTI